MVLELNNKAIDISITHFLYHFKLVLYRVSHYYETIQNDIHGFKRYAAIIGKPVLKRFQHYALGESVNAMALSMCTVVYNIQLY